MAKIIIAYLSPLTNNTKVTYSIPGSAETVEGTISSEAPIKYFLMQNPDIEKVLCIVTDFVEKSKSYEHIIKEIPEIESKAVEIVFRDEAGEVFEESVIPQIIEKIKSDDEIFFEVTGGPRVAAFQINRLLNVLSFKGCTIAGAAYAQLDSEDKTKGKVLDASQSLNIDLVSGLSEFARFGDCRTLTSFFKDDPAMKPLLEAMQAFSNSLALCQTEVIDKLKGIEEAIEAYNANDDNTKYAETRLLLEIFKDKFPLAEKPDILTLIEWCADNNLIQQALTIYNERVPEELINRGIIALNDRVPTDDRSRRSTPGAEHHSSEYNKLRAFMRADAFYPIKLFKQLAGRIKDNEELLISLCSCRNYDEWIKQHDDLEELHDKDVKDCFKKVLNEMKRIYGRQQNRNSPLDDECNNCDRQCFGYEKSKDVRIDTDLMDFYSTKTKIKFLKKLQGANDKILSYFNENMRAVDNDETYRYMLDHFEQAVDYYIDSNKTQAELDAMKTAVSDYMFILALRNHVCHASEADEDGDSKYQFLAAPEYEGYPLNRALSDPACTADEIKKAVKHIRDCSELFRRR